MGRMRASLACRSSKHTGSSDIPISPVAKGTKSSGGSWCRLWLLFHPCGVSERTPTSCNAWAIFANRTSLSLVRPRHRIPNQNKKQTHFGTAMLLLSLCVIHYWRCRLCCFLVKAQGHVSQSLLGHVSSRTAVSFTLTRLSLVTPRRRTRGARERCRAT